MKSSIILPVLALALRVAALPPACLLHAVNTADDPADMSAVCGNDAEGIQQFIFDLCDQHEQTAQEAFIATCSSAGTSVAAFTPTTTRSSTPTGSGTFVYTTASYNSDCDCTSTEVLTATGTNPTATGMTTTTGTSTNSAGEAGVTGNAAEARQVGSFAAAVVAIAGVVAVL